MAPVAIGQNQPLLASQEVWTAEVTLTEGQLRGKRDTFWETAPAYDGRREIWDALRAACEAVDKGQYELAQAIVDGANISLPTGRGPEGWEEWNAYDRRTLMWGHFNLGFVWLCPVAVWCVSSKVPQILTIEGLQ